ncbi:MAG: dephospho-CoA kinase [Flavobacteriales bacterium]
MKTIGITGGIGSGKSTVCRVFQSLGVPVFDSDYHARKVYEEFPETLAKLRSRYGESIIRDGKLDRVKLASIVFASEEELAALNKLIHPYVKIQFENWRARQVSLYVLREAAILFESGSHTDCSQIILVTAPLDLRIQRTMQRDQMDENQVKERISRQWSDDKKRALSDFEIINDDQKAILPQILSIHERLLRG